MLLETYTHYTYIYQYTHICTHTHIPHCPPPSPENTETSEMENIPEKALTKSPHLHTLADTHKLCAIYCNNCIYMCAISYIIIALSNEIPIGNKIYPCASNQIPNEICVIIYL